MSKHDNEFALAGQDTGNNTQAASSEAERSAALSNQLLEQMISNKLAASANDSANGGFKNEVQKKLQDAAGESNAQDGSIESKLKELKDASGSSKAKDGSIESKLKDLKDGSGSSKAKDAIESTLKELKDGSGSSKMKELKDGSATDKMKGLKDASGTNKMEQMDGFRRPRKSEIVVRPDQDGVEKLSTGDTYVKDGDREILFMPNGDKLSVNKDGSYDLRSKGGVEVKSKDGHTTLTFANGDQVTFSKDGISSVSRDGRIVHMMDAKELLNNFRPKEGKQDGNWKEGWEKQPNVVPGSGGSNKDGIKHEQMQPNKQGGGSIEIPADLFDKLNKK